MQLLRNDSLSDVLMTLVYTTDEKEKQKNSSEFSFNQQVVFPRSTEIRLCPIYPGTWKRKKREQNEVNSNSKSPRHSMYACLCIFSILFIELFLSFFPLVRLRCSRIRIYVNILVGDVVCVRQAHARRRMLTRFEFNNKLIYFSLRILIVIFLPPVAFVVLLSFLICCCCFFSSS